MRPSGNWRSRENEDVMNVAHRLDELCRAQVVFIGHVHIDWGIGPIPNTVAARFEAGVVPDAPLHPCYHNAMISCVETNTDCSWGVEAHGNASAEPKKLVAVVVTFSPVDAHEVRPNGLS